MPLNCVYQSDTTHGILLLAVSKEDLKYSSSSRSYQTGEKKHQQGAYSQKVIFSLVKFKKRTLLIHVGTVTVHVNLKYISFSDCDIASHLDLSSFPTVANV